MVDRIYALMTRRQTAEPTTLGREGTFPGLGLGMALPEVSTNTMAGLMETLAAPPYNGHADLPPLADSLQMAIDDLFPVGETLQLLRFAEFAEGDIKLTPAGMRFAEMDVDARKKLFGDHLLAYVPLGDTHQAMCSTSARRIGRARRASSKNSKITCPRNMPSGR